MFETIKRWLGWGDKSKFKDHRGRDLRPGEKSVSQRIQQTAASKNSVIRRNPIDMAQGD